MPFTLAHPAAVLPLKRLCSRPLNFCALVVGSLAPDVGYCFGRWNWGELSHHFIGGFVFCLPVGLGMLIFIYGLRRPFLNRLPARQQQLLLPQCWQPIPSLVVLVSSVLVGIWTHLAWDSFTHAHGWLVTRMPLLQARLAFVAGHTLEVCHVLWYASSFAGVAIVCFAYERCLHAENSAAPKARWHNAVLVGILVLPIETIHHLVRGATGFVLVGACSLVLMIGVAWKISRELPAMPSRTP